MSPNRLIALGIRITRQFGFSFFLFQFLVFIGFLASTLWLNHYLHSRLALNVASGVRNNIITGDVRQALLTLNANLPDDFFGIAFFTSKNERIFSLPATAVPTTFSSDDLFSSILYGNVRVPVLYSTDRASPVLGELIFIYRRSIVFFYALLLGVLSAFLSVPIFIREKRQLERSHLLERSAAVLSEKISLAQQVAHDIRSPLAALQVAEQDLAALPEDTRIMIRSAIGRIKDITNGLQQKSIKASMVESVSSDQLEALSIQLIPALIEGIVTEKRLQYRSKMGIQIEFLVDQASYGIFVSIQPVEFKRVLSNLVNNCVEAISDVGEVKLSLSTSANCVALSVQDNGKGIATEIIPRLMQRGESHGKEGGSGLGLFHAHRALKSWGGTLELSSQLGRGTQVTLILPIVEAPHWFVPEIILAPMMTVVVLDDDSSIHQIWKSRFEKLDLRKNGITLAHFSTPTEVLAWRGQEMGARKPVLYLFDYELIDQDIHGLALIEQMEIASHSILVTSRYEDETIRRDCRRLGVKLIPKGMAGFVPIRVGALKSNYDAILIDDDPLVHLAWKMSANRNQRSMLSFSSSEEFLQVARTFDFLTPIYVDAHLKSGMEGVGLSRILSDMGFKRIYIATGYSAEDFGEMPWLLGVLGKEAPWG